MTRIQQGVSLVELMLVVLIIGFLISLALPVYQGYMVRTQQAAHVLIDLTDRQPLRDALERSGE